MSRESKPHFQTYLVRNSFIHPLIHSFSLSLFHFHLLCFPPLSLSFSIPTKILNCLFKYPLDSQQGASPSLKVISIKGEFPIFHLLNPPNIQLLQPYSSHCSPVLLGLDALFSQPMCGSFPTKYDGHQCSVHVHELSQSSCSKQESQWLNPYSVGMEGIWGFPPLKVYSSESDDLTDSRTTVLKNQWASCPNLHL